MNITLKLSTVLVVMSLTYTHGNDELRLWFNQSRVEELRANGLSGADLFNALKPLNVIY